MSGRVSASRQKIVVIGAGFGGLSLVHALAKHPVDVVLIDRRNHHLFQPLLYQVATAALSPEDIASPIRSIFARNRNVEVLLGEVDRIDLEERCVSVSDIGMVAYDQLVVASGVVSSWFGHDEWAKHSIGLKSLHDADVLRQRLLGAFELAESRDDAAEIARLLTFAVVGGGPSGVELAAAIRDLIRYSLARDFRRIQPAKARILLFEGGPGILAGFPARLVQYADRRLRRMGVEVCTGARVDHVDADGVVAAGERISAANVFWCAGVTATPAAEWMGMAHDKPRIGRHGTLVVEADCSLADHPEVFAIGDVASYRGKDGQPLPGVAPVAKQQGRYVARVIAARVAGSAVPGPFYYNDQGSLAIIGRSAAVASLPHLKLVGFPAFLLWGCVHLFLLVGLRNRLLVYIQWVSAWLSHSRGARLIDGDVDILMRPEPTDGGVTSNEHEGD